MTLRFGSIIIHKPDPKSEGDSSYSSSDDAEVAEVAETATVKYNRRHNPTRRSDRQKSILNKSRGTDSRRSSISSNGSNDFSILRIMSTDKSPPLVRSHYSQQGEHRLQGKDGLSSERKSNHHRNCANSSGEEMNSDGERLGFRVLTSGSRTPDNGSARRRGTPVPDMTSSFTTPFVPIIDDDAAIRGISRLLKNLNFTEKLRQQKAEQERLDVHKLPNHMKEQLKHIYVY